MDITYMDILDYAMEKFGRYVLQMEFTMLEVYIRRNGKHQIPRKKNIEDSRKTSAQNQKQIMYSVLCIMYYVVLLSLCFSSQEARKATY